MNSSNKIVNELILPDAIKTWKKRWDGSTVASEIFRFWRTRHFLIILIFGIILNYRNGYWLLLWIICCCLFDYIILRSRAKKRFQFNLKKLEVLISNDLNSWDKNRKDKISQRFGEGKIINSSPAHVIRKEWISQLATRNLNKNLRILDAGCKDGESVVSVSKVGASIVGLDLNRSDLKMFNKKIHQPVIQSNILNLPLKNCSFDNVFLLEVIEHLNNPLQGLVEIFRVLKPGGMLILSTDNRNHLQASDLINPMIVMEKILGLVFHQLLCPKSILWEFGENIRFYHTSFSRNEIIALIKNTKLRIISLYSYYFLPGFHKLVGKIRPGWTQNDYLKFIFPIERFLVQLPIIRALGDHWLIVLRKPI